MTQSCLLEELIAKLFGVGRGKWQLLAQDNLYFQKSYKNRIKKIDNRSFWFLDEIMVEGDILSKRRKVTIGKFFDGID